MTAEDSMLEFSKFNGNIGVNVRNELKRYVRR